VTLLELPRRARPRVFIEPPADLERRVKRALRALGELPDELADLPGLETFAAALIGLADALEPDPDLEDADDEILTVDDLPLFAAARARPP
jgi:hypothetical protein